MQAPRLLDQDVVIGIEAFVWQVAEEVRVVAFLRVASAGGLEVDERGEDRLERGLEGGVEWLGWAGVSWDSG